MTETLKNFLHGLNAVALINPSRSIGALPIPIEEARQNIEAAAPQGVLIPNKFFEGRRG